MYDLIREGKIVAKALGRRTVIPRESLVRYIDSLPIWTPRLRSAHRRVS
jgi:hypothetical protein